MAIEAARRSDQLWQTADTLRHVAWAAHLRGDVEEERRLLGDALDLYRHKEIVHWTRVVEARLAELDQER